MLPIRIEKYRIKFGSSFAVSFERTLRVPDDDRTYPLPPDLGSVELMSVGPYQGRVPSQWAEDDAMFPLYQREAIWIALDGKFHAPHAVQIGVGNVNAVSGTSWEASLRNDPQNYVVSPPQPWLDGINIGEAKIRQFVAMPLGESYTIEKQITGKESTGGIQLRVYALKPDRLPPPPTAQSAAEASKESVAEGPAMGLAAGGVIEQRIYPDSYDLDDWNLTSLGAISVHILNSEQFEKITGTPTPPPRIDAHTYNEFGLPWFRLYDEGEGDIAAPDSLAGIRSVKEIDEELGKPSHEAEGDLSPRPEQIKTLSSKRKNQDT